MSRLNTLLTKRVGHYKFLNSGACYVSLNQNEDHRNLCTIPGTITSCSRCQWQHRSAANEFLREVFGKDTPLLTYELSERESDEISYYEQARQTKFDIGPT